MKVLNGEPVEINPAVGHGFRVSNREGRRYETRGRNEKIKSNCRKAFLSHFFLRRFFSPSPLSRKTKKNDHKIMTVDEWSSRWKCNDDYPECLHCGSSTSTRECHFVQTWCRAKKCWEAESLCLCCQRFSWRSYRDPDFKTPEQYEAERWAELLGRKLGVREGEKGEESAASSPATKIKASS
jgi:hypothetical protein